MTVERKHLLETARRAASAAAEIQLACFGRSALIDKKCGRDVKLALDRESEEAVIATIRERFPDHMIYSEETGFHRAAGDTLWIIDPLDGSVNFFHGLHYFCCSIACFQNPVSTDPGAWTTLADLGTPVAAVITAPAIGETYSALANGGVQLNGVDLDPAEITDVNEAIVGTSFGSSDEVMLDMFGRVQCIARDARKIRCLGTTALGIAQVASGQLNAYVQRKIHAWDIAAACIIASEAGCFVKVERDGLDKWKIVACNKGLVHYFKDALC